MVVWNPITAMVFPYAERMFSFYVESCVCTVLIVGGWYCYWWFGKVPADLFAGSITVEHEGSHHWLDHFSFCPMF